MLGDLNINIQRENRSPIANKYINIITSHAAVPLITEPTRVTTNSSSIIDHIITNDTEHDLRPIVIETDLTDHYPIFCVVNKFKTSTVTKLPKTYYRDKSTFSSQSFCDELEITLANFILNQPLLNNDNFDNTFNNFISIISSTIDKHAPLKPLSRKQQKLQNKPWITKGILNSIKNKRSMFKSHFINGSDNERSFIRTYSNKLTKIKALSKKLHYSKKIEENQKEPRKLWNIIRSVLPNCSKHKTVTPISLSINGCATTTDCLTVSDHFNNFFVILDHN